MPKKKTVSKEDNRSRSSVAARKDGSVGALGLVRAECANFRNSTCLGIEVMARYSMPLAGCLLHMGLPCAYFEKCILPLSARRPDYATAPHDYGRVIGLDIEKTVGTIEDEALQKQLRRHPFLVEAADGGRLVKTEVRRCACGAPLAKRARRCDDCAKKQRKKAYREKKERQRQSAGQASSS
jgi:hypothetical protein